MFRLWVCTEDDLFDGSNPYRLRNTGQALAPLVPHSRCVPCRRSCAAVCGPCLNTGAHSIALPSRLFDCFVCSGQGLNRVQAAPRVGKSMYNILHQCQRKLGNWVGSSVIHLGDHNVPNALNFVDKYTQVSRILNPIVLTIKAIPRLCEKKDIKVRDKERQTHGEGGRHERDSAEAAPVELKSLHPPAPILLALLISRLLVNVCVCVCARVSVQFYIDTVFGGAEALKMLILTDFFRHAFDGSGAENFFDAGSCIDGRLTSAWNCQKENEHGV